MIRLDSQYVISTSVTAGGQVVSASTTDTLCLTQFAADFTLGTLYATIARGTVTEGAFIPNMPPYVVTVNPDGTFSLPDGSYSGTLPALSTFIAGLKSQLDTFILSSGRVTGTAE